MELSFDSRYTLFETFSTLNWTDRRPGVPADAPPFQPMERFGVIRDGQRAAHSPDPDACSCTSPLSCSWSSPPCPPGVPLPYSTDTAAHILDGWCWYERPDVTVWVWSIGARNLPASVRCAASVVKPAVIGL